MTGYDIFKRVCALLGCYDFLENTDNARSTSFCGIVNQIALDLKLGPIENLSQEIGCNSKFYDALIYGCAMLFSASLRDNGCVKMYSQLYSFKRSKALSTGDTIYDVLPSVFEGGI